VSEQPASPPGQITGLLRRWSGGDKEAADALFPIVYRELRQLARGQRRRLRAGATLNTTAVVHEAYLKLVDAPQVSVRDRQHFLALAARAMRQILVDHARRRRASKRGADAHHTDLDGREIVAESKALDVLALEDALNELGALEARLVQIVELRFFAGLSVDETAEALGLAPRTVDRDWRRARAFLHHELRSAGARRRNEPTSA
jgi:RNA polymerase sigma factor (TIGR02999 family)